MYLNKLRVTEPDEVLTLGQHILPNNITLLRTGNALSDNENSVHGKI